MASIDSSSPLHMTNIVTSSGRRKSLSRATTVMLLVLGIASRAAAGDEPARLLLGMETAYARVHGDPARFVRQEVVDGELRPREEALLKFRRPGLIYLRWVAGPPVGRQILFVPGKNHDRMLVREPGLADQHPVVILPGDEEDLAPHRRPGDPSQIDEARATEFEERLLARPQLAVDHLLADEARRVAV